MGEQRKLSRAAFILGQILDNKKSRLGVKLREALHRTILSRARHGRRSVSTKTAAKISEITRGRIRAEDWEKPVQG